MKCIKNITKLSLSLIGILIWVSCSKDDSVKFTKEELKPSKPVLSFPKEDAKEVSKSITLKWESSENKTQEKITYDVYITDKSKFTKDDIIATDIEETEYMVSNLKAYCDYKWKIIAKSLDGIFTESVVFNFKTVANKPNKPELISPVNDATNIETITKLIWNSAVVDQEDILTYDIFYGKTQELEVAKKIKFEDTELEISGLEGNTTYYWKIVANNVSGEKAESDIFKFKTTPAEQPAAKIIVPADKATDVETSVNFSWKIEDANGTGLKFDIFLGESETFKDTDKVKEDITEKQCLIHNLKFSTTYYWQVVVKDGLDNVVKSNICSFTTLAPSPVKLLTPVNGFEGMPTELTWEKKEDFLYSVYISTSSQITEQDIKGSRISKASFTPYGLNAGVTYYWQVKGMDKNGQESESEIFNFTTPNSSVDVKESEFIDSDGLKYKTVIINGVEWMAENYARLPSKDANAKWGVPGMKPGEVAYEEVNSHENYIKYGLLYTVDVALEVIPEGWHIATDEEWNELEKALGMAESDEELMSYRGEHAPMLKSSEIWSDAGTNDSKMTILPAGNMIVDYANYPNLKPADFEMKAYIWTSTAKGTKYVCRILSTGNDGVSRKTESKTKAYSIRLVRNK